MLNKVNNFKIFIIFNEKFIFLFCELCQSIHNTFMVKVGSFTVYFKIIHFWVTSWLFKKVPYDIVLTCNYGRSIFIFWWFFYNKWLLYSDKTLDLNYACVAKIVPGTTKSLLFFCMLSFWSSIFSICNRSKVGFNCFTITGYFFEKFTRT